MKILDYYTIASLTGKAVPDGLDKFAIDEECEVYGLEKDSIIVICNAKNLGFNEIEKENHNYIMCIIGRWGNGIIKSSETKEELEQDYRQLISKGLFSQTRSSTNIKENVKNALKK